MKSELIKCVDSRAVCVEITDCERLSIQMPYAMHSTGKLVPERVDMRWENGELVKLRVSGGRIKKDGTVGMSSATTHYVWYGRIIQDRPGWLSELVTLYRPVTR